MKKYQFLWLALPVGISVPFLTPGCAGTLTPDEIAALQAGTTGAAGSGSTTGGPMDCAEQIFAKECGPGMTTIAKCQTCSGLANCHGKETPAVTTLDLTAAGLEANEHGKKLVGLAADDVNGSCGAAATPTPIKGKVIIDPMNPENSLLYQKVIAGNGGCGSAMPFTSPKPLTADQAKCILDWIKKIPGVMDNGGGAGGSTGAGGSMGAGGSGGSGGSGGGSGGSGGSSGGGTDAGKGGGATDAGKG
jgi:hypothetical protein